MGKIKKISVLIVDDHRLMRDGLRSNLERDKGVYKIFEAENGKVAIQRISDSHIDVVVMDVKLPGINGIAATQKILHIDADTKVLGLTMHVGKLYVMGMLQAGAKGFLTKMCSAKELCYAIQKIHAGDTYICEEVMDIIRETAVSPFQKSAFNYTLTRRENQILKLIAEGKKNNDIADILNISIRTVEKHRKNITNKTGVKSTALLTKLAIKNGLTFY